MEWNNGMVEWLRLSVHACSSLASCARDKTAACFRTMVICSSSYITVQDSSVSTNGSLGTANYPTLVDVKPKQLDFPVKVVVGDRYRYVDLRVHSKHKYRSEIMSPMSAKLYWYY